MKILRGIKLGLIRVSAEWQHRDGENTDHTRDLADALRSKSELPPLDVVEMDDPSGEFALVDGYHRLAAMRTAKIERADLRVVAKGNESDAAWWACRANIGHGLRRSNDEKRNAVRAALLHPRGDGANNEELAAHCGVSPRLVSDVRAEVERPAARTAATARVDAVVAAMPEASERAIAKAAGVSASVAHRAKARVLPSSKVQDGSTHKAAENDNADPNETLVRPKSVMPDAGPWERVAEAISAFLRTHHGDIDATGESNAQAVRAGLTRARETLTATRPVACPKHSTPLDGKCSVCGGRGWIGDGQARALAKRAS